MSKPIFEAGAGMVVEMGEGVGALGALGALGGGGGGGGRRWNKNIFRNVDC